VGAPEKRMSKEDVIVAIRRAFAETRRPDLHDFVHCEQCEIFLGSLLDSCPERWQDIRSEDISRESSALTAVTPLGWRFLLPAYMLWHLQQYDQKTDANTVDNLVWNLAWDEDKDEHIVDGFRSLSRQQAAAVDAFLSFIEAESHDARLASDATKARQLYWARAVE
jgi:hypothetical protein